MFAMMRWANGEDIEVPAIAVAWTRNAVEVEWEAPGSGLRADWIDALDVRRAGTPPRQPGSMPPRSHVGPKRHW